MALEQKKGAVCGERIAVWTLHMPLCARCSWASSAYGWAAGRRWDSGMQMRAIGGARMAARLRTTAIRSIVIVAVGEHDLFVPSGWPVGRFGVEA